MMCFRIHFSLSLRLEKLSAGTNLQFLYRLQTELDSSWNENVFSTCLAKLKFPLLGLGQPVLFLVMLVDVNMPVIPATEHLAAIVARVALKVHVEVFKVILQRVPSSEAFAANGTNKASSVTLDYDVLLYPLESLLAAHL